MKRLILFILPWTLLFGCSEPENGLKDKRSSEQVNRTPLNAELAPATDSPPINKRGRVMVTRGFHKPVYVGSNPASAKIKEPTYGGYTMPELIEALYAIESTKGRNKNRRGLIRGAGRERGPFQFTRQTWHFVNWHLTKRRWSFSRADSYYYSEKAAYTYMHYLIKRFTRHRSDPKYQPWQLAMLGWNGGPTKVAKGRTPPNAFRFLGLITKYLKTGWYYGIKD